MSSHRQTSMQHQGRVHVRIHGRPRHPRVVETQEVSQLVGRHILDIKPPGGSFRGETEILAVENHVRINDAAGGVKLQRSDGHHPRACREVSRCVVLIKGQQVDVIRRPVAARLLRRVGVLHQLHGPRRSQHSRSRSHCAGPSHRSCPARPPTPPYGWSPAHCPGFAKDNSWPLPE